MHHQGYGVEFHRCAGSGERVDDTATYRYREEKGFFASVVIDNNTFTGLWHLALEGRNFGCRCLRAAKRFTRMALKKKSRILGKTVKAGAVPAAICKRTVKRRKINELSWQDYC